MGSEPTIESSRIDSSSHEFLTRLSRLGADTFGYKAELSVDKELAQLLRLRVAQINDCTYCLIRHYEAARSPDSARPYLPSSASLFVPPTEWTAVAREPAPDDNTEAHRQDPSRRVARKAVFALSWILGTVGPADAYP